MNQIRRIAKSLTEDTSIVIVHQYHSLTYPEKDMPKYGPWQSFGFYIAPKMPMYDPLEFNAKMNRLLPGERQLHQHDFRINSKAKVVIFGSLHYEELVGTKTCTSEIALTDDYGFEEHCKADGIKFEWKCDIKRSIVIWAAPNERLARLRAEGEMKNSMMKLAEYEKYTKEQETAKLS